MNARIAVSAIVVWLALLTGVATAANVIDITAQEAKTMIDETSDLTIIDVSPVWANGHIPGSINLFVGDGQLDAAIPGLDKTKPYLVYCHTDEASNLAVEKLFNAGFTSVYRLYGNYGAWEAAGFATATPAYTDITVAEAKTLIDADPNIIIIDVSPVYTSGHIPGAINLYVGDSTLGNAVPHLNPNAEYLVYCHVDAASIQGAQTLVNAGFSQVKRLAGNYSAWIDAGYATETSTETYTDISPADANTLINSTPDLVIIDVSPAYADGHLPDALHYPLGTGAFHAGITELSKDAQILVYCHTDEASMAGAQMLADAGFMHVSRLTGNYGAWVDGGYTVQTPAYTDVDVASAKTMLDGDMPPVVIDVSPVYASGHIPGAVHYSLGDGVIGQVTAYLPKNGDYLVYCHTDAASMQGVQALVDAGFTRVKRLAGNYSAWTDAGYAVTLVTADYRDISALAADMLIDSTPGIVIVDVSPHYNEGHIPDAISLPFGTNAFQEQVSSFDSEATYLIYCHADAPSQGAAELLDEAGFDSVYRLYGNFAAWVDAGLDVAVPTSTDEQTPGGFELFDAFPNPFNPQTTITYIIPEASQVTLSVYNVSGQKVATLVDGILSAGNHSTIFDGSGLASGEYLFRFETADAVRTGKMMLMK